MNLSEVIRMARQKKSVDLKIYDKLMKVARDRVKSARSNAMLEQAKDSDNRSAARRSLSSSIYS